MSDRHTLRRCIRRWTYLLCPIVYTSVAYAQSTSQKPLGDGGGIAILSRNLLDTAPNDGTAALLLSYPSTHADAVKTCLSLNEQLWNPDSQNFSAVTKGALAGLVLNEHLAVPPDQRFWVASSNHEGSSSNTINKCRTIDLGGNVVIVDDHDCSLSYTLLPALCTQSAPMSNATMSDNSTIWQASQAVEDSHFIGFRDLHAWKFLGVRFAAKPERFAYSKDPVLEAQDGSNATGQVISAVSVGADCSQPIFQVANGGSEDCLFLNIWTPYLPPSNNTSAAASLSSPRPVIVWLYGGDLTTGSASNPDTDGTNLASRGEAVIVEPNYRLGNMGFLPLNDGVHNGNYGLSDMVTALRWVRRYIRDFGGDPERVTLMGLSAGAKSAHALLASPEARGLFQRVILQSDPTGDPSFRWPQYVSPEKYFNDTTVKVLNESGCLDVMDQVACLRKMNAFDFVNLTNYADAIVRDGTYITSHELVVNQTGPNSNVSVLTGNTRDETAMLIKVKPDLQNGSSIADYFQQQAGDYFKLPSNFSSEFASRDLSNLAVFYPHDSATPKGSSPSTHYSAEDVFNATVRVTSDGAFICLNLDMAYSAVKSRAFQSVYAYQFNRTYSPAIYTQEWCNAPVTKNRPNGDPDAEYYKCHGGDQSIVFGNIIYTGQPDRDGLDTPFSALVIDYWSSFVRSGDPNPSEEYLLARGYEDSLDQMRKAGLWKPVTDKEPSMMRLQWNGGQTPLVEEVECEALKLPSDMFLDD